MWGSLLLDVCLLFRQVPQRPFLARGLYVVLLDLHFSVHTSFLMIDINTIGYISTMSGATYAFSLLVMSAATIGSGGAFTPTTAQI